MLLKCNTCDGEYDSDCGDGMPYFHACPPLSLAELKDAIAAGTAELTPRQTRAFAAAKQADDAEPLKLGEPSRVDTYLSTLSVPRPMARDENVVKPTERGKTAEPKSEGGGTTEIRE